MSKLPTTIRTFIETLDTPEGLARHVEMQNSFNQAVYEAASGQLTFQENIRCIIKELPFTTLSTYSGGDWEIMTFPNTLKTRATGVFIMQLYRPDDYEAIVQPVSIDWLDVNGVMQIRFVTGLENATKYLIRVMVV